jgi:hypothetical protein
MENGQLCRFTHFALQLNRLIDRGPVREPAFSEVHEAAKGGRLVGLVASCSEHPEAFSLVFCGGADYEQLEAALRDGAMALEGREMRKAGVEYRGLCLVMAIVLEAIQQQFLHEPENF